MTHIYYVYEYKGDNDRDIKPYRKRKLLAVNADDIKDGIINQSVFGYMMGEAIGDISDEYGIENVDPYDVIILFWSEIRG